MTAPVLAPTTPVDLGFFETAPLALRVEATLPAPPAAVFACLEDAESWPAFAPAITRVTWTSPAPRGVGATRTVEMVGDMVAEERFVAWEPGARMAFTFTAATVPVESFGEDWRIAPVGEGASRVTWTMAFAPKGHARLTLRLVAPLLRLGNRWMLRRLSRLVTARAAELSERGPAGSDRSARPAT